MTYSIQLYERADGTCPFEAWFDALDSRAALKVRTAIARMETGNLGDSKSLGGGLMERRLTFGPGYRVYFGRDEDRLVILLTGGTKRRQAADIDQARTLWSEYRARRNKEPS